jgi:deazaflavin-dependent oxidoreductase (nitroreductase family)
LPRAGTEEMNRSGSVSEALQFLYLTTKGRASGLPREIEIWFTQLGNAFYVIAEYETSQWVKNIRASPQVEVRVGDNKFGGIARFISPEREAELHEAVRNQSREKYGWGEGLVVELKPHS